MAHLTTDEEIFLLGLLEDTVQEDDFLTCYPLERRLIAYNLIKKFGGTYFGKGLQEMIDLTGGQKT